jgi:hypothetical protein
LIDNNIFTDAANAVAIWLDGGWWTTVSNNTLNGASIVVAANADNYRESKYNTITGNEITHGHIDLSCGSDNTISNNTITNASWAGPYMTLDYKGDTSVGKYGSSRNVISGNEFTGGWGTLILIRGSDTTVIGGPIDSSDNQFIGNTFTNGTTLVEWGQQAKNNTFSGNTLNDVAALQHDDSGGTATGNVVGP